MSTDVHENSMVIGCEVGNHSHIILLENSTNPSSGLQAYGFAIPLGKDRFQKSPVFQRIVSPNLGRRLSVF